MIITVDNLPPETSQHDIRALFDHSAVIEDVRIIDEGDHSKPMAIVEMAIDAATAEALRQRYHHRWWHGRSINVNIIMH
jgi:hypothetical protein